jgi:tetratricopeptide (TPR) repeat protein
MPGEWRARTLVVCVTLLVVCRPACGADSREALQKAASLVQQGRLEEADRALQPALSDPETRAVACSVLGTIRFQQKRTDESIRLLDEAIRLEPHLVGAHLTLAQIYFDQGKPERAQELFQRVLRLDPANAPARLALARWEADRGNYQKSLQIATPVLTALKESPDGLIVLATDYLKIGDRNAAAALTQDWARLAGVPPEWSVKFALLLARAGVVPEAINLLERTKGANPPSYEVDFNLAGAYLLKGDAAHALENYDLALAVNPDSLPALQQAARVAEQQGNLERALSYWIRAKKIAQEDPEVLLGFGRVCLKMDLLDDADPALTKAVELRPENPAYRYTLAAAKVGRRQFQAAAAILEQLVQEKPQDPQLEYALGAVLYLEGHLEEAATHLKESVRLQPEQLAPYYYLALVARDQGNEAEAIRTLESLLRRYPDHASSCEVLGSLFMSAHQYTEAENSLEKAVRLNPKSVKANYQLGLLLSRMGKKEEAEKQMAVTKSLRTEDEATSRLQLRLLDPDQ